MKMKTTSQSYGINQIGFMKLFRIKEKYLITGWSYVRSETLEEAKERLETELGDYFEEENSEVEETYWDTLEEFPKTK